MSELRAATISNLAGTGPIELTGQVASKSWVNFDGTDTVSIRESFNASSITDNGTGDYTVNFNTAMADANYVALVSGSQSLDSIGINDGFQPFQWAASSLRLSTFGIGGESTTSDFVHVNVAIIR